MNIIHRIRLHARLFALAFLMLAVACGPAREGLMSITPGVPANSGCTAGAGRCNARVPEVCSASGRWWPALPRDAYGAQRVCLVGCAMDDAGVPYCVPDHDVGGDGGASETSESFRQTSDAGDAGSDGAS